jgi:hypothetical protein
MSGQQDQINHLAAQVEALKIAIAMIDSALRARGVDGPGVMNEAFDNALSVVAVRAKTPAWNRAGLVLKEMQDYLGATGPVSAAVLKRKT